MYRWVAEVFTVAAGTQNFAIVAVAVAVAASRPQIPANYIGLFQTKASPSYYSLVRCFSL